MAIPTGRFEFGNCPRTPDEYELQGHRDKVYRLAFDPFGKRLASLSWENIRVWDLENDNEIRSIKLILDSSMKLLFVRSGAGVSITSDTGSRIFDFLHTGETITIQNPNDSGLSLNTSIAIDPIGKLIVLSDSNGACDLFDILSGKRLRSLGEPNSVRASAMAFSPNTGRLAIARGNQIEILDSKNGKVESTLAGHAGEVTSLSFDPTGVLLASGGNDQTCKVWNITTSRIQHSPPPATAAVSTVHFRNHNQLGFLYGASVAIYDLREERVSFELLDRNTRGNLSDFAFAPNKDQIATSCYDDTIKIWDIKAGKEVLAIPSQTDGAFCVIYTPDGERLVSGDVTDKLSCGT